MSSGVSVASPAKPPPSRIHRAPSLGIAQAKAADRTGIRFFLNSAFPELSNDEYRVSWDDPFFEPVDRLLVKRGRQIVGHVHVMHRTMLAGQQEIPVGCVRHLTVGEAHRGVGLGARLLRAAEAHMIRSGALVGLIHSAVPHFFRRYGWALYGQHCLSRADTCRVLGSLLEHGLTRSHRRSPMHIRPMLCWELAEVVDVYRQSVAGMHGPFQRSEAYWRWLVQRHAYDHFHVALQGPSLADIEDEHTRVVGYAITQAERLVELRTLPGRSRTAAELLARACGESIEANRHGIIYHGPPGDPLHDVIKNAGGRFVEHVADRGEVMMAKVLRPLALLRRQSGRLLARADAGQIVQPWRIDLLADGRTYCLEASDGQLRVRRGKPGPDVIEMNAADFSRVLLGRLDWDRAFEDERVFVSSKNAAYVARVLFPLFSVWRPPLDSLERSSPEPLY